MRFSAFILAFLFWGLSTISAQSYRIYFKDKGSSDITEVNPYQILSHDALERRAQRGIPLDQHDLPVSAEYRRQLREMGLQEVMCSRWLNYVMVADLPDPKRVENLNFVSHIEAVAPLKLEVSSTVMSQADSLIYGFSGNQIEMLNGQYLHNDNQLGQGMRIAVLDAGFQGSKNLPGLDSLWAQGRVIDSKSFIATDTSAFRGGTHGTLVLGVMAGYLDSLFVGSAPRAEYLLYRTEFEPTETTMEMDNWVAAAERADSMGVDIINTSLGYTQFDGGVGDYSYVDLDGNTTVITRAADLAASRGILVVASAGNLGDAPWRFISAPADGDSVLAVGAVLPDATSASFSSWGPTVDGRIKPDVSAQGVATAILLPGGVSFGNGTSFSSPIIAGLAACLWQDYPSLNNMQILEAIRNSASQFYAPDNRLGFGIANFRDARWSISQEEYVVSDNNSFIEVHPNPVEEILQLETSELKIERIQLFDLAGNLVRSYQASGSPTHELSMPATPGIYVLSVYAQGHIYLHKIIRK